MCKGLVHALRWTRAKEGALETVVRSKEVYCMHQHRYGTVPREVVPMHRKRSADHTTSPFRMEPSTLRSFETLGHSRLRLCGGSVNRFASGADKRERSGIKCHGVDETVWGAKRCTE